VLNAFRLHTGGQKAKVGSGCSTPFGFTAVGIFCLLPFAFCLLPFRVSLQSAIQNPKSRIQNYVSALRRSSLGHGHGQAIGAGMDDSASRKTEETITRLATVTCVLQIWWLSPFTSRKRIRNVPFAVPPPGSLNLPKELGMSPLSLGPLFRPRMVRVLQSPPTK